MGEFFIVREEVKMRRNFGANTAPFWWKLIKAKNFSTRFLIFYIFLVFYVALSNEVFGKAYIF